MDYYRLLKPILLQLPAELSHELTLSALALIGRHGFFHRFLADYRPVSAPVKAMGLSFPNPIGLAAGLDKNGIAIPAWYAMGFGFVEVGTVTPKPQPGNPKPRLFRIKTKSALINRMGFNNDGVEALLPRLHKQPGPLGVNIGKNKDTPIERALEDYLTAYRAVYSKADYVTLNLSSPNTAQLRELQYGEGLRTLLLAMTAERKRLQDQTGYYRPLVVKIAPDLSETDAKSIAETVCRLGVDGIIATNTTLDRTQVNGLPFAQESGGLSGSPLSERALTVLRWLKNTVGQDITLIAAGGIMSEEDAVARQEAGATLIQLYTGLIYKGPRLIKACCEAVTIG